MISWPEVSGAGWRVETAKSPEGPWQPVEGPAAATADGRSLVLTIGEEQARFYRLRNNGSR